MSSFVEIPQNVPDSTKHSKDISFKWDTFDLKCNEPLGFTPSYKNFPVALLHGSRAKEISKLDDLLLPNDWNQSGFNREADILDYSDKIIKSIGQNEKPNCIEIFFDREYFVFPKELKQVAEEIECSKSILELTDNWNDEGAIAVPEEILMRAIKLLVNYSKWIFENLHFPIEAPIITPLPDGSLDLKWKTSIARLLVNVKNSDKMEAHYYGDLFNNKNSVKGNINTNDIQEFFAYWMANLKK